MENSNDVIRHERKELDIRDAIERTISREKNEKEIKRYNYRRKLFDCIIYCQITDTFLLETFFIYLLCPELRTFFVISY